MSDQDNSNQLINKYRREYEGALAGIETEVSALIKAGKEMRAIMTFNEYAGRVLEIREQLGLLYEMIVSSKAILEKFGSERLKRWRHNLAPTMQSMTNMQIDDEAKAAFAFTVMVQAGYQHKHWILPERLLVSVDYMLDVLQVLVEPDFMPIIDSKDSEGQPDRRISSEVKIAVWRRDGGKCARCGNREKLEFDHIIPVSQGGSNTERNIELLCERCNRAKGVRIQ